MFTCVLQQCFDEIERVYDESTGRDKKLSRDDWAHGSLLVTIELLRCSNVAGEVCMFTKWTREILLLCVIDLTLSLNHLMISAVI